MRVDRADRSDQAGEFAFLVRWARTLPMFDLGNEHNGRPSLARAVALLTGLAQLADSADIADVVRVADQAEAASA
jgi:hypothetical protein